MPVADARVSRPGGWTGQYHAGMPTTDDATQPHAFLSYVREDAKTVDRIQIMLEAAGVRVWRDTEDLWPGEDWRLRIREAIQRDALVFIAFFSDNSARRTMTYQNEELNLAVEQLRLRRPDQPWLIPVRLSDRPLPSFEIAPGRGLDSLQCVDLFHDRWETGTARLLGGVLRILESFRRKLSSGGELPSRRMDDTTAFLKATLHDDSQQIQLEDFVMEKANHAATALLDTDKFPASSTKLTNSFEGHRFLLSQADRYWKEVEPLIEVLVVAGTWARPEQSGLWSRAIARVANTATAERGGNTALLDLRRYPVLPLLYAGGVAAVHRGNYETLRAITWDARVRQDADHSQPLVGTAHVWRPFSNAELVAQLLAFRSSGDDIDEALFERLRTGRQGKRYTPVSDHLHNRLRDYLRTPIPDDIDYTETFDRLEVLLGTLAIDAAKQAAKANAYLPGAWYGSFTWRDRHSTTPLEQRILAEIESEGEGWPPMQAGLFGGSAARAKSAMEQFVEEAAKRRGRF